ncbi:hypothetical protein [Bacillus cytotoxicus]|nr:hypothetical protein [Bacillus cytotoxicus]
MPKINYIKHLRENEDLTITESTQILKYNRLTILEDKRMSLKEQNEKR